MARHTGLMLPLFSAASTTSWGLGELPDIVPARALDGDGRPRSPDAAAARRDAGRRDVAVLGDLGDGDRSDPHRARRGGGLPARGRRRGAVAGSESAVWRRRAHRPPCSTRTCGARSARRSRSRSRGSCATNGNSCRCAPRASPPTSRRERWWLDDYSLSRAIVEATGQPSWRDWHAPLRDREPAALDEARRRLWRETLRHQYWQWLAETQWQAARAAARAYGVTVLGDLPFVVGADSADVWVRPAGVHARRLARRPARRVQ